MKKKATIHEITLRTSKQGRPILVYSFKETKQKHVEILTKQNRDCSLSRLIPYINKEVMLTTKQNHDIIVTKLTEVQK